MSLVSTLVQSQEGSWYSDPTIREEHWFICWDDDEPIELVVKEGIDPYSVIDTLRNNGWLVNIDHENECCGMRIFGEDAGIAEFHDANAFFLEQDNGPPDDFLADKYKIDFDPMKEPVPSVMYPNKRVRATHQDLKSDLGM